MTGDFVTQKEFGQAVGEIRQDQGRMSQKVSDMDEEINAIQEGNLLRNGVVSGIQQQLARIEGGVKMLKYAIATAIPALGLWITLLKFYWDK